MAFAPRSRCAALAIAAVLLTSACDPGHSFAPDSPFGGSLSPASVALSSYFPPPEAQGGWRRTTDTSQIQSLGIDAVRLADVGSYLTSLPYEQYGTGVSGYNPSDKAVIVIKNGWIVGEYYNQPSAATDMYYLASNGKVFTILLAGQMARDYPQLGIGLNTKFYDPRWLAQGFPLTDPRKADITFDQVFRHTSGIIPQVQDKIADGAVEPQTNWTFPTVTVGKDPDYPVTAPLYFAPGVPSTYTKGSTYSSVAFNHFSLIFRNVTGLEASVYLRQAILDPIGIGRMAFKTPPGLGDYVWATAGNGLTSARDFARVGYLMLHEGDWNGRSLFEPSWLRQFTTSPAYPNIRSNVDCRWGPRFPSDMYRTTGSGQNWALVVPSLDLVMTFNGRTPQSYAAAIDTMSLNKLFAAVTDRYVACDGTIINDGPTAAFTSACTGLDCTFADGSSDADGTVDSWAWDFGDGNTSTGQSPSHTYPTDGTYRVTLTVTDDEDAPTSVTHVVVAGSPNLSPIADFTASCLELACTFTDGSSDPDGSVASWSWDFGDGGSSTARNPNRTYAAAGTYAVVLTITDNGGLSQQHTAPVTVATAPPPPPPPPPPPGISLTASGSQQGPDQVFQLAWTGAVGAKVDVYRNGHRVARTPNDGSHTDVRANVTGRATYIFTVCQSTTTVCSNEAKVVFK